MVKFYPLLDRLAHSEPKVATYIQNNMKIISLFNHKGGVSKTTTAYHLAWKLTQKNFNVLMVDTDSQCNLSLTAIGEDNYEQFLSDNGKNNIKDALDVAFKSRPQLIPVPDCQVIRGNERLFLLPGSFEITEFEVQLGVSFQLNGSFTTMESLPGSFYYLINKCAERYNIDYVIIDMNPSLSAINQDLISISNYFILPTSPDYFSHMALKSMSRILPLWERWAINARNAFIDSTYPLPTVKPKLLGYTVNDFNIRKGKPTSAFADIMQKTDDVINDTLYPSLETVGMVIPRDKYENDTLCLARLSNFQHLGPKYQEHGVPVFALTEEQIGTNGTILEGHLEKQSVFNNIYENFADNVIRLTQL